MIWPRLFKRWIALSMHLINHYPVDKYQENQLRHPVARELYDGQRYPPFEQLGPEGRQKSTLKFSWCPFYEGGSLINRQPVQRGGVCTDMCLIKTTTLVQLNPSEDIVIFTYPWFEFLFFFSLFQVHYHLLKTNQSCVKDKVETQRAHIYNLTPMKPYPHCNFQGVIITPLVILSCT